MSTNKADDLRMEWEPGQLLLGDFEVQRVLGQGGMGKVYLVRSRTTATEFAVKHTLFKDDNSRQNFLSELQTWIDLPEHPHIAACRFFRTIGNEIAIFSEYVSGGTLAEWIQNRRLTTLEQIVDVAIQFAWGLQALHEHGLIHQDVKPGNVLMTSEGIAKVTDFGLSRARSRGSDGQFRSPTPAPDGQSVLVSFGGMTQAYCSPEQAAKRLLSRKTDIWSWGVSVLDMLIGGVSCRYGQTAGESLESYIEANKVDEDLRVLPDGIVSILRGCFQPLPEQRWENLVGVADALTRLYPQICGRTYPRAIPTTSFIENRVAAIHDRRAMSGVQWIDPREWLATVLQLEGADLSDPQLRAVPAARTRKAQAVEDLAIYDNIQRRLERLVASGRSDLEMQLSMVYMDKALVHQTAGDPQGACSMYERAAAIREKLALHGTSESSDSLALVYQNHASLLFNLGDTEKSLAMCDRAIEIRERLVVEEQQEQFADGLAVLYMNKGVALGALEKPDHAVFAYDQAIDLLSRLIRDRSRRDLDKDLARAYQNKAMSLKDSMSFVQSFRCYDDAIAIFERLIRDGRREVRIDLAGAWMNKASLFLDLGHKQDNIEISRRAVALLEELVTSEGRTELSHLLARAYTKMGNALLVAEDYEAGIAQSDRAVELWKRVVNLDGRQEFLAEAQQTELGRDTNRKRLANLSRTPAKEALGLPKSHVGVVIKLRGEAEDDVIPNEFDALIKRAHELADQGRFAIAESLCRYAYSHRPDDTDMLALASLCALKTGQLARASQFLHSLVRLAPHDKAAWWNLSRCLFKQELRKQGIFAVQKVIELDAQDGEALNLLADALLLEEQFNEAIPVLMKLNDIPGWEIPAVCKQAHALRHTGMGIFAFQILSKAVQKHRRCAALWFTMAQVLRPFPDYREEARTAAENAAVCLADDPRQLLPEHQQELSEMRREFAS